MRTPAQSEPKMKDERSLGKGIADLFNLNIPDSTNDQSVYVYIDNLVLNKEGKCVDFYATVNDQRTAKDFSGESKNKEMAERLNNWIKEQTFDTKLIPKGFDHYLFCCVFKIKGYTYSKKL
jgi:hypothetical protein